MGDAKQLNQKNDIDILIATGHSRMSLKWKNEELTWQKLLDKLSNTTRTRETVAEYSRMAKSERDKIKDVGGFVGGALKEGRRKIENLANRSLVTLDLDNIDTSVSDVWDSITMFYGCELCIYSTHSHRTEKPRLRLIIPINRKVFADEYQAIARRIASEIGIDMFDDTTYEPSRLMYWPSTPSDGEYIFKHQSGEFLNADSVLDSYLDWKDISFWPVSSRQDKAIARDIKKQEDPLEKDGIVGAFCRAYTIDDAIDTFLSDVYEVTATPGRYTYIKGSTVGGLVVYEDKFAFSHHGTDPTSGMLCNAFDLVRIHLYGLMDEDVKDDTPVNRLPSFTKMIKEATNDVEVKKQLGLEKLKEVDSEFFSDEDNSVEWLDKLSYDKKGNVENTIDNALTVLENDPRVKGKLIYDAFANRASVKGRVPWTDQRAHEWSDMDNSGVRYFLENNYQITTAYKIEDAKNLTFDRNKYHPVKDYLNSLEWDKKKRVDTLFIDYLGAEDSIYTRDVARTQFVGAVSRIFEPGIKFDTMPTLAGPQGIGKSTFIYKISKGWYSDSLDTMKGKEAAELIQGVWHVELGELNATRKSDRDMVKAFLSRQYDIYRVAYAQNTTRFPRQCVFWGTTNDSCFLRDPTGDRRTYPIDCAINPIKKSIFRDLDDYEVDQIWAEAVHLYNEDEPMILTGEALKIAEIKQAEHREDTPLSGLVESYLDDLYPSNWDDMELSERVAFLRGDGDTFGEGELIYKKDRVCVLEIWCELLGKKPGDLKPINSREINDILHGLSEWEPSKGKLSYGKLYGQQRGFKRTQN
ncbi:VapE domain-containing protein [Peptoniphilus asaccharolyticus]